MKTRIFAALLAFVLLLCSVGCDAPIGNGEGETGGTGNGAEEGADAQTSADTAPDYAEDVSEMFTERDGDATYDGADVRIDLLGDTATATSDAVRIDGARVTVTAEATYYVTGTLNSGQIIVDAPENAKVRIILDGVTVTSGTSAALYVRECDKLFVTLAENSENILASGSTFTPIDENDVDAAVFSKSDLTLNGTGSLFVSSPAGHGIVCKDDLVFTGGSYQIAAASHGIDANDSVRIRDVQLSVTAGKDALRAENNDDASLGFVYIASGTFDLSAAGDGVSAGAHLQIENGAFTVTAGGGAANAGGFGSSSASADTSAKALKGQTGVRIANGTFTLDSADDAVHSNGSVTVSGGVFAVSTGDDGFHADETLTVSGGEFDIIKSYEGLEGLHVAITGGKIRLIARDDGVNAAGGKDGSGMGGRGDDAFGGMRPRAGGMPGGAPGGSSSSGSIVISGGTLYIEASGDGIDANGTLEITGGQTVVCGPTQGDTATLDYDGSATISGGTFIGTGASGMAQTFSNSAQGVISVRLSGGGAGTEITLKDADGKVLITHTPALSFSVVILSCPEMVSGEPYTVTVGENAGTFTAK